MAITYNRTTGTVTTTFDSQKFANATDLSIARTILHESVHAYLIAELNVDPIVAQTITYPQLWQLLLGNKDPNNVYHIEMTKNFIKDIGNALQEFGQNKGYNLPLQFYQDMAWGGLTYDPNGNILPLFINSVTNQSDRDRILNLLGSEQTGYDLNNNKVAQKGSLGGC